jgi:vacuolar protein sorting-associated protein 13A/C
MEHPLFTMPVFVDLVTRHYTQAVLGQVYKVIGSADFLGNPVGLFNMIGSGVKDVFYEPYQGFVSDRPQDFGIGLAKGTASFLKKTVYGFSDTFSKFTGSVGKGLASATLDSQYQEERRRAQARNRPRHAVYGVAAGASSFARSIVSGVTGIVEQPMKGAEKEGVGGFIKGVGKGLLGFVYLLDLASLL